jgi:hypothetical protein
MLTWAHLLGFVIGAVFGALLTDTTIEQLHNQADLTFSSARWRKFRERPNLIFAATRLLRLEATILVIAVWALLVILIWFCKADHAERDFFVGSVIGVLAAPWMWLHFARSLRPSEHTQPVKSPDPSVPSQPDVATLGSEDFDRYKFLTIVLGIAVLVAVLLPSLPGWLSRAEKFEALGLSVTLAGRKDDRGSPVVLASAGHATSSTSTTDKLADATRLAYQIVGGKIGLSNVGVDLQNFENLPAVDRERAYIAFLTYIRIEDAERKARNPVSKIIPRDIRSLQSYVDVAERELKSRWPVLGQYGIKTDVEFLQQFTLLSKCLWEHASWLKDYHLYTIDVGPFLRSMAMILLKEPTDKTTAFAKLKETSQKLTAEVLRQPGTSVTLASTSCDPPKAGASLQTLDPKSIVGLGSTPYPMMMLAYYMAAIDSVEGGVELLNEWITENRKIPKPDAHPEWGWYDVRAMLAASQLPYHFGSMIPAHSAQIHFQEKLTDRMAALLGVGTADSWRRFCRRLQGESLHTRIGKTLAFIYASERFYLFELLGPQDFAGSGETNELVSIKVHPDRYVAEAQAMGDDLDCFAGVTSFDSDREANVGMFNLYIAQLLIAEYEHSVSGGRSALLPRIRAAS